MTIAIFLGCTVQPASRGSSSESLGADAVNSEATVKASVDSTVEARTNTADGASAAEQAVEATVSAVISATQRAQRPADDKDSSNSLKPIPSETELTVSTIIFVSDRVGTDTIYQFDLYTDDDGQLIPDTFSSGAKKFSELINSSGGDHEPQWSPDGGKIAFASGRDSNWIQDDIEIAHPSGDNRINITNTPAYEGSPTWSPDGSQIAFESEGETASDIWVMGADGSNRTNISDSPYDDHDPSWSPDGNQITFASDRAGWDIYVMNTDGSNQANITNSSADHEYSPSWSPQGDEIVFISDADKDGHGWIYAISPDGSNRREVISNMGEAQEPEWSPDGSKIVFTKQPHNSFSEIWVIDADGTNSHLLWSFSDGNSYNPHWGHK